MRLIHTPTTALSPMASSLPVYPDERVRQMTRHLETESALIGLCGDLCTTLALADHNLVSAQPDMELIMAKWQVFNRHLAAFRTGLKGSRTYVLDELMAAHLLHDSICIELSVFFRISGFVQRIPSPVAQSVREIGFPAYSSLRPLLASFLLVINERSLAEVQILPAYFLFCTGAMITCARHAISYVTKVRRLPSELDVKQLQSVENRLCEVGGPLAEVMGRLQTIFGSLDELPNHDQQVELQGINDLAFDFFGWDMPLGEFAAYGFGQDMTIGLQQQHPGMQFGDGYTMPPSSM
jgi:hypothetical protein